MKRKYFVKPTVPYETTLEFSWDSDTGKVTGRDADRVLEMAGWREIFAHPLPAAWEFSQNPLTNKTDMAAIIGSSWELPEDLRPHYPEIHDDTPDQAVN